MKERAIVQDIRHTRYIIVTLVLLLFFVILVLLNIGIGSMKISAVDTLIVIFKGNPDAIEHDILWKVRLPRMAAAIILGGALALSGFLLQTFFNNPIAGPFVLGISSGAKLAVALVMVFVLSRGSTMNSAVMITSAFVGAILSMGFVLLIACRVSQVNRARTPNQSQSIYSQKVMNLLDIFRKRGKACTIKRSGASSPGPPFECQS